MMTNINIYGYDELILHVDDVCDRFSSEIRKREYLDQNK